MKTIFLLLLLVPFFLMAQDCGFKKDQDPISSKPTLNSGFIELSGATLSIEINNKEIDFFFVMSNPAAKCLDENIEINFLFEGGKLKTQLRNSGSMNCDGIFHLIFKNTAYTSSQLQRLGAKKVVQIRLTGENRKPVDINLTADQQTLFMKWVNCVLSESKTVL